MKVIAVTANLLLPGFGSLIVGKAAAGIAQFIIWGLGLALTVLTLGVGAMVGVPMMLVAWIWAIVSAISEPPVVTVITKSE